jgi:hypothetical protein
MGQIVQTCRHLNWSLNRSFHQGKFFLAELINGRLAMMGFLWATIQEAQTGDMFLSQALHAPVYHYLWALLWVYASMVPIMHGALLEPFGPFTPRAEIANGRAAMIGIVGVAALEYSSGVPFF